MYNRNLCRTKIYKDFQKQILNKEIETKEKALRRLKALRCNKIGELKNQVTWIDFNHFQNFVRKTNDTHVIRFKQTQRSKLIRLGFDQEYDSLDPNKLIFNLSSKVLSTEQKDALSLGLKFAFPLNKLSFYNYFLPFERLSRSLKNYDVYGGPESNNIFNTNFKHLALSYFYNFDHNKCKDPNNLKHIGVLKDLAKDKELMILRPDKGYGIVLMDRTDYLDKMNVIISDVSKFRSVKEDWLKLFSNSKTN